MEKEKNLVKCIIPFLIVDLSSPYNIIIGRPILRALNEMISMEYLSMKFLTKGGVRVLRIILKSEIDMLEPRAKEEESRKFSEEKLITSHCLTRTGRRPCKLKVS